MDAKLTELKRRVLSGDALISIYGLGYVGLPLAMVWLKKGGHVIGVDTDREKIEMIKRGENPLKEERELGSLIKKFIEEDKFRVTVDGVKASKLSAVKIVTVPTWLSKEKKCDLSALLKALHSIVKGLKEGDLVSIEPTVPPTTTETVAREILESKSGLRVEDDFYLVYSPERVYIGRVMKDIEENYPKIVGGIGSKSTEVAASIYSLIARKGVIKMSSATAAETVKIFEGVYRDVNIALANELARFTSSLGLDFMEVREAANSQPYCHLHLPGCGVGGACIPYYPYYLMEVAAEKNVKLKLTELGRDINESMPDYCVSLAFEAIRELKKSPEDINVAVLGLAFRGNISDTRESPAYAIIEKLKDKVASLKVHDPHVEKDPKIEGLNIRKEEKLEEAIKGVDLIMIITDHSEYKKINPSWMLKYTEKPVAIIDGRNMIDTGNLPKEVIYRGIGRSASPNRTFMFPCDRKSNR